MPGGLHASTFLSKLRVLFSGQIVELAVNAHRSLHCKAKAGVDACVSAPSVCYPKL